MIKMIEDTKEEIVRNDGQMGGQTDEGWIDGYVGG